MYIVLDCTILAKSKVFISRQIMIMRIECKNTTACLVRYDKNCFYRRELKERWLFFFGFGNGKLNIRTNGSINFIACYQIVLMFGNDECKISFLPFSANMNFTHC